MKKFSFMLIFATFFQVVFAGGLTLQIQIIGISGKTLQNATERLKNLQTMVAQPLSISNLQTFYNEAPKNVKASLEPFGYFHPKVSSQLKKNNNTFVAIFVVNHGPVTLITSSTIQLDGPGQYNQVLLKVLQEAKETLSVKKQLNTVAYEKIKQEFYTQAETQGYLKGYFSEHLISVDRSKNTAIIKLTFNTGPQYYFGAIYFSKNPMSIDFLKRYVPFQSGDAFSSQKLMTLQNNLAGTIYFTQVNVTSNINKAKDYYIPIDVKLVPAKAHKYSFGLGYGTDTGIRGSVGLEWRRATRTGNYFQTLMQVSEKQNNNLQARYIIPGKNPITDYKALTAGIFTNEPGNNGNRYTTEQIGINYVKLINQWQRILSLQLQHENFKVNDVNSESNTLLPGISWEKFSSNNRINVNNGYRMYFNLQGGLVAQNTNASFLQAEFQGKYIHSFDHENNRILLSTDLGTTLVKNFAEMPLSQRFFAGGAQSLRGFDYQSLGPGRYLALGGIEWQHRLFCKIYGTVFYNAGNAVENLPFSFAQAAGVGVVYRSIIGPIEITIAHPFNQPFQFNRHGLMVQFSMGPDL